MPRAIATRPPGTRPGHSPHWSRPCRRRADHRSANDDRAASARRRRSRRRAGPHPRRRRHVALHAQGAPAAQRGRPRPLRGDGAGRDARRPARSTAAASATTWPGGASRSRGGGPRSPRARRSGCSTRTRARTLVVLKRRGTRLAGRPQAAPVDLAAVRGAATVARRAATLAVGSRFVEPRRTELHALATEADAARAGVVVTDGVFIGAFAAAAAAAGTRGRPRAARRRAPSAREPRVRRRDRARRGRRPQRHPGARALAAPRRRRWVLRAVDGRACWTPGPRGARRRRRRGGAATVRVDLERAYDRRDIVLPLSTEARLAVILAPGPSSTRARTRRSSRRRPRSGAARSA